MYSVRTIIRAAISRPVWISSANNICNTSVIKDIGNNLKSKQIHSSGLIIPTLRHSKSLSASAAPVIETRSNDTESVERDVETSDEALKHHDQTSDEALKHHDYFSVRKLFTVRDLFNAGVHLGHKKGLRDPYMSPFIIGTRLGVDVLDLDLTAALLGDALNFLAHIAYREGVILFLSRNRRTIPDVETAARGCGEYAHCRLWRGGTMTNSTVQYGAVTRLPDVCLFLSTEGHAFRQHIAVTEATKMNIPTAGVVDSSCDPRLITYPIPGNDDSPSAINLYLNLFCEAIKRGKEKRKLHVML